MIDLRIRGARIIDGTGAASFSGDIEVDKGRIIGVGESSSETARRSVDAGGLVVSPGFFDLHTHYDAQWFWESSASPSCWHGITSVLTGNCGFSLAPARNDADRDYLVQLFSQVEGVSKNLLDAVLDWGWSGFGDYLERIEPVLGINVAAQVGHSALRHCAMGEESYEREASDSEISSMCTMLETAMQEGAIGFSTLQATFEVGPFDKPVPSQLASYDELRALARSVGKAGTGIVTVSPYPGAGDIDDAYQDLLIEMSRLAGGTALWNAFQHRWDQPERWRDLLAFMERAAGEGAQVFSVGRCQSLDLEFDFLSTRLFIYFPTWHDILARDHAAKLARFSDRDLRRALAHEFNDPGQGPSQMIARNRIVEVLRSPKHPELEGRPLAEIAMERGIELVDLMLDTAVADDLETRFMYRGLMNGDTNAVRQILESPYCVPGVSDAGAHLDMDCGVDFSGRLLSYWVRDEGLFTLEEAVRRLTSMSADVIGVRDRGRLLPGQAGDLVLFDPEQIATGERETLDDVPGGGTRIVQRAVGVEEVYVNGVLLVESGRQHDVQPGRVLGRGAPKV